MTASVRLSAFAFALAALAAGCAALPRAPSRRAPGIASGTDHVPPFARIPYEPFSRADAVAIALREWRLWGQKVDDDPPGNRPPPLPEDKPERQPGLWQRVGEYWWTGQRTGATEAAWTGTHDENGKVFPAREDGDYAWSAAFVSYVMRIAGAGDRFPYAAAHNTYINLAREQDLGRTAGWALAAEAPEAYAPRPGDLICAGRGGTAGMKFADLPTADTFTAHCAIVVDAGPPLSIIGGNVDDAVTLTHVPVTADGRLAQPDGEVVDFRYPWFVVLKVLYDR